MHDVYEGAYLTMVAATSTSQTEDPAIPGVRILRQQQQIIETVEGVRLITAYPDYDQTLEQSRWVTRGWNFPEELTSKRCLMFTDHQMYLRCTQDARCEDIMAEPGTEEYQSHPTKPSLRQSKVEEPGSALAMSRGMGEIFDVTRIYWTKSTGRSSTSLNSSCTSCL